MSNSVIDVAGKMFSGVGKRVTLVQNFPRHSLDSVRLYWDDGRMILRQILV